MQELPSLVVERIERYSKNRKLSPDKSKKLIDIVKRRFNNALVSPGDAVGLIAAQSFGEPATQMTLRSKHYAGSLEESVSQGIQRVIELVDARSSAKYQTMTIYLRRDKFKNEKQAQKYCDSLIDIKLRDIGEFEEDFANRSIIFKINEISLKMYDLNLEEIADLIYDKIDSVYSSKRFSNGKQQINFKFDNDVPLYTIRKSIIKWMRIPLAGVKNIEKAIMNTKQYTYNPETVLNNAAFTVHGDDYNVDSDKAIIKTKKDKLETGTDYIVHTKGSNLKEILKLEEFIDIYRTSTNDVFEIYKIFGIEAARNAIVKELKNTYDVNGITVNKRHLFLIADLMTFGGKIRGVVRTGITGDKKSPFARAAFEETVKHIIAAAFNGESENLLGITENIIVGQPISAGTGIVRLTIDPAKMSKMVKANQKAEEKKD
ncbi:MAG: hypothetical protein V1824_04615 [archaeon]